MRGLRNDDNGKIYFVSTNFSVNNHPELLIMEEPDKVFNVELNSREWSKKLFQTVLISFSFALFVMNRRRCTDLLVAYISLLSYVFSSSPHFVNS